MHNILFFGDSLTAGYGLAHADEESFPSLIGKKVRDAGFNYQVLNAGVSGDTSAAGLARIDYWLSREVDVFVLELGINDILRGIPPVQTRANLQSIINRVKARYPNVRLALMGMEIPAFITGAFAAEFRSIFRKLADFNGMAFVPFFLEGVAGIPHLNMRDGLHPTAAGYQLIADKTWPLIRLLLK